MFHALNALSQSFRICQSLVLLTLRDLYSSNKYPIFIKKILIQSFINLFYWKCLTYSERVRGGIVFFAINGKHIRAIFKVLQIEWLFYKLICKTLHTVEFLMSISPLITVRGWILSREGGWGRYSKYSQNPDLNIFWNWGTIT